MAKKYWLKIVLRENLETRLEYSEDSDNLNVLAEMVKLMLKKIKQLKESEV